VGTGEYTTGFVGGGASKSDKKVGVVGLTLFDLRRRGKVGDLSMVGVSGGKYPAIRRSTDSREKCILSIEGEHLQKNISEAYNGLDVSFDEFPKEGKTDPDAYKTAIDALPKGSASKSTHATDRPI
jgi:D-galacturonate reductase